MSALNPATVVAPVPAVPPVPLVSSQPWPDLTSDIAINLPTTTPPANDWRDRLNGALGQWLTGTLTSMLTHVLIVLGLVLYWWRVEAPPVPRSMVVRFSEQDTLDASLTDSATDIDVRVLQPADLAVGPSMLPTATIPAITPPEMPVWELPRSPGENPNRKPPPTITAGFDSPILGGLTGTGRRDRRGKALERGATAASEEAVERGLAWFAAHQRRDGAWRFDHRDGACDGTCANPGHHAATTASTALALLAFYGAGYDHRQGKYAEVINNGLYYLGGRMLLTPDGGDLQEGSMYAQGIAAIAFSEAAALTDDPTLRGYAERAIQFIIYAQDRTGGGWRYHPGEPGDMTVTGWQLMALKSGQLAGVNIHSTVFQDANRFLDSVESADGAAYGYRDRRPRDSTTAVGLLCRMYLGRPRSHAGLQQGIAQLDRLGPSRTDLYYNYYATQVMMHYGGEAWERWNPKQRQLLIDAQARDGHQDGSWYFADQHNDQGGRLLSTALAVMTLEVYYRYQPLYQTTAAENGF